MLRNFLYGAVLGLTVLVAGVPVPASAAGTANGGADGARQVIDRFHATLLSVMKQAEKSGTEARYKILEPEVAKRFDLRLMIALATGKHWRAADKPSREALTRAFHRFTAATYASRFSGYSGQSFNTVNISTGPRKTELVKTEIRSPDKAPVNLTYVTRKALKEWRIVDVLLDDGISELAVRRSEYAAVLKSDGVKGLVRMLDENAAKLLKD